MAYADDLVTIRDKLAAELAGETTRRAALVAAGTPPPTTYNVGGKNVMWNEYLKTMQELIKAQNELVVAAGADGGLFEEVVRGYT